MTVKIESELGVSAKMNRVFWIGVFGYLVFALGQSFAASSSKPKNPLSPIETEAPHLSERVQQAASQAVDQRLGVEARALTRLWKRYLEKDIGDVSESATCMTLLEDSWEARSQWVDCLYMHGLAGLNEKLALSIQRARQERSVAGVLDVETKRTLALLFLMEDAIRERRNRLQQSAQWLDVSHGFLNGQRNVNEFSYQDGDVVLMMGGSSVSALISQSTLPERRYSHAALVRVNNGRVSFEEALVEKGVVSTSLEHYRDSKVQLFTVLRWNGHDAANVARKASDCAHALARRKTAYNFSMDMTVTSSMFCSQLVVHCYSQASGVPLLALTPMQSDIRSDVVFNYLSKLGVASRRMVSPGDLLESPHFSVVAQWRRVGTFERAPGVDRLWRQLAAGDVFVKSLEKGAKLDFSIVEKTVARIGVDVLDSLTDVLVSLVDADGALLPRGINARSLGMLKVQEEIFQAAVSGAERRSKGFFETDPVEVYALVLLEFENNPQIRSRLSQK